MADTFEEHDEEILDSLASGRLVGEVGSKLEKAASRFRDDFLPEDQAAFWDPLLESVKSLGFHLPESSALALIGPNEKSPSIPVAFETPGGMSHVAAVSNLLRVSREKATKLTLGSLSRIQSESSESFQALLGTRALLETVIHHHFDQRRARIGLVTECLRIELDQDSPLRDSSRAILESLDGNYLMGDRKRGIFQRLLALVCAKTREPSRSDLLPILQLRSEDDRIINQRALSSDSFVSKCVNFLQAQRHQERELAMEALLVLLYERAMHDFSRTDYALLLIAFQDCHQFFTNYRFGGVLARKAGMACVECVGLCSATTGPGWINSHPLFSGASDGGDIPADVKHQIDTLLRLLIGPERRPGTLVVRQHSARGKMAQSMSPPESLGLYAFGLLLCLAVIRLPKEIRDLPNWQDLEQSLQISLQFVVDDCESLAYLTTMLKDGLVESEQNRFKISPAEKVPDWQFSSQPMILDGCSPEESLDPATVTSSSIGLEMLGSTLVSFPDFLGLPGKVELLCDLAAVVFANRMTFCQQFWDDLDAYIVAPENDWSGRPNIQVYHLLDTAFQAAVNALNFAESSGGEAQVLEHVGPLMRLMSSLCANDEMVGRVFTMVPPKLIHGAVLLCSSAGIQLQERAVYIKRVNDVLDSIYRLAKAGQKSRDMIKESLSARSLCDILVTSKDDKVVVKTLRLLSFLIDDPVGKDQWAGKAVQEFSSPKKGIEFGAYLSSGNTEVASVACDVLNSLAMNLTGFAFNESTGEKVIVEFINVVSLGVIASCMSLPSTMPGSAGNWGPSLALASSIMKAACDSLGSMHEITSLHPAGRIREAASNARDAIIQAFSVSTNFGRALSYYAGAPVALCVTMMTKRKSREGTITDIADAEGRTGIIPWRGIPQGLSMQSRNASQLRRDTSASLSNAQLFDIDFQEFEAEGLVFEGRMLFQTASLALDLVNSWASAVDLLVETSRGVETSRAEELVRIYGPSRLLCSSMVAPPAISLDRSLQELWPTELALLEMLVPYFAIQRDHLPASVAFSVVLNCLLHLLYSEDGLARLRSILNPSGQLHGVFVDASESLSSILTKSTPSLSQDDEKMFILCLQRLEGLRGLVSRNVSTGVLLLLPETSPLLQMLFRHIKAVASSMQERGTPYPERLANSDFLLCELRVAAVCLDIIHDLMRQESGDNEARGLLEKVLASADEKTFFSDLLLIVELFVPPSPFPLQNAALAGFVSKAIDTLAFEQSRGGHEGDSQVKSLVTRRFGGIGQLLSRANQYARYDGAPLIMQMLGDASFLTQPFLLRMMAEEPLKLLQVFSRSALSIPSKHDRIIWSCDLDRVASFVSSLDPAANRDEVHKLIGQVAISFAVLLSQLALACSWSRFLQLLCVPGPKGFQDSIIPISDSCHVLKQLHLNLDDVMRGKEENCPTFLALDTMSEALTSLLLMVLEISVSRADLSGGGREVSEFVALLNRGSRRLEFAMESSVALCTSKQRLLTCAILIISSAGNEAVADPTGRTLFDYIVEIGCGLRISRALLGSDEPTARAMLLTCATMLTLVFSSKAIQSRQRRYLAEVVAAMKEHGILKMLVDHAQALSSSQTNVPDSNVQGVAAVFHFILSLSETVQDSPELMKLLVDSELASIILDNPFIEKNVLRWTSCDDGDKPYRGYLRSSISGTDKARELSPGAGGLHLSGKDDPVHSLWRLAVRVVAMLARVSGSYTNTEMTCIDLAVQFTQKFHVTLSSCLEQCSRVLPKLQGPVSSDQALTYNLLMEACETLSLLSELTAVVPPNSSGFLVGYQGSTMSLLSALCGLLGFGGMARELFGIIGYLEKSNDDDTTSFESRNVHPSLVAGIANGRFEAVRMARFVGGCYAPVSAKEYEGSPNASSATGEGPKQSTPTIEILERRCLHALSSEFNLRMEWAAATCVMFGLEFLWTVHPSSNCFTVLAQGEASRFADMRHFKPGMVIATGKDGSPLEFAFLKEVDTVRCNFLVHPIGSDSEQAIPFEAVLGVEDLLKRKGVLHYVPAPDMVSEAGKTRTLGIGHLILALRWCKNKIGFGDIGLDGTVQGCLAERALALLATELHLAETESLPGWQETTKRINLQVLDLMADRPGLSGEAARQAGQSTRLESVVHPSLWGSMQEQLKKRMEDAIRSGEENPSK